MKSKEEVPAGTSARRISVNTEREQFPIVGIGASAGGLEALEQFFVNMPENNGMAFVVIQHLDPNHIGILPELLQRFTAMKVLQATDRLKVKPGYVYVIPPNKSLSLLNGDLHLFDPVETRGLRLPVDVFFRSLAADKQDKSIGIILSGMGSDGSLGIKAIKEKNGIVLVQDPASAKFDGMPRSAIESVIPDIVAPADELPARLIAFLKLIPSIRSGTFTNFKEKSSLEKIIILIREQTGHDFSLYKKTTLLRRIERRKGVHQINEIQNYVRFLQKNPKEIEILFNELLIGVTSFFRDTHVWKKLRDSILPVSFETLPDNYVLRAWVPGCSTGEEAYSLAIIFKEALGKIKKHKNLSLQIFATDIDRDAIEKARKGFFASNINADVPHDLINKYFTTVEDGYHLIPAIREMVVFAEQNVIRDPPFTKLDILSCRNMLIYMEAELQKKILVLFNYSLNPGGLLLLGTSETTGVLKDGFKELDPKVKVYKRSLTPFLNGFVDFPSSVYHSKTIESEKNMKPKVAENLQTLADQIILQRFAPASVLVNEKGDILYITGHTGKYIEPAAGKANWNIYAMAREGLRQELPGTFRKAMQSFSPVIVRNIKIGTGSEYHFVDLTVQRIENPESIRGMIIVIFNDVQTPKHPEKLNTKHGKRVLTSKQRELEDELQRINEELQSTREEMQTSQEELKSTNEELQSTNEELQSNNEELTTSREEMQSLNEELQTLNSELQSKLNDLTQANNDMKNLLNSTEIATLFLDRELHIRRFTDPVMKIFKLRGTDVGRPFTEVVNTLLYPEIEADSQNVLRKLISVEKAVTTTNEKWFNVRIMPYRTLEDRIDGLVITFSDTTTSKKLEIELKEANKELRKKKS